MTARFIFSLVIGASLVVPAALAGAQGPPRPGGPGGAAGGGRQFDPAKMHAMMRKRTEDELKKVHANPGQSKKILAYSEHIWKERMAFMKAHQGDRTAMQGQGKKWREEQNAFLKKTLNGKQFTQWEADMKAMRGRGGGGGRPGGPGGPGRPKA